MAENTDLSAVFLGEDYTPAASIAADTSTLAGPDGVGTADIEGVDHAACVVVYPVADVSSLDPATVGAAVSAALEAV